MPTPSSVLQSSLESHNETFESLLKLIPAKYYIPLEQTEEQVLRLTYRIRHTELTCGRRLLNIKNIARSKRHPSRLSRRRPRKQSGKRRVFSSSYKTLALTTTKNYVQLDPEHHKTIIDLQNESANGERQAKSASAKGKRKAVTFEEDESGEDGIAMDVDVDLEGDSDGDDEPGDDAMEDIVPLPESGGIEALRDKLHARMAALRRGGGPRYDYVNGNSSGDKDALLNERRLQRAAMRERRRKETKEKIRREEEMKGKGKGKEKEKDKGANRDKGNITQVCSDVLFDSPNLYFA
jgi:hypothetical protein